ncbi:MAG TPA: hypothetical protein VF619_11950 [Allosphingosinicella sp.]|jgi:hypothetical protein
MHPEIEKRLTAEAEVRIPLAFQYYSQALRSTVTMNGAGVAGILALLQPFPESRVALAVCSVPFVLGLIVAIGGWLSSLDDPTDSIDRRASIGMSLAKVTFTCAGLFVFGVIATLCTALGSAIGG